MKDLTSYYYNPDNPDYCTSYFKLKYWLNKGIENRIDGPWLWVGSGLSIPAGYPSGGTLAEKMLLMLPPMIKKGLDKNSSYELIADRVIEVYNKSELAKFLERELGRIEDTPLENHVLLAQMPWKQLITTNYDRLLERAWIQINNTDPVAIFEDNYPPASWDEFKIWKIHGDKKSWKDVILSKQSYKFFDNNYRYLQNMLETGFFQSPIVFVGCSMKDSRLYTVLQNIESNNKLDDVMGGVYIIHEDDYNLLTDEERQILDRFSLEPLIIRNFDQITEILQSLPVKKTTPNTTGYFSAPSKLLAGYYHEPGRLLEEIHSKFTQSNDLYLQAVFGTGGIGKTRTAIEYAYKYRDSYPGGVYWFNCVNSDLMMKSLENLVEGLGYKLPAPESVEEGVRWRKGIEHLKELSGLQLWILDNLEEPELLARFPVNDSLLPIKVLITTRKRTLGMKYTIDSKELSLLEQEEAEKILLHYANVKYETLTDSDKEIVSEIVKRLDRLTLAVELAGRSIKYNQFGFELFRNKLAQNGINMLAEDKEPLPNKHVASIKATYLIDQQVKSDDILVRLLLHISMMAPDNIEKELLELMIPCEDIDNKLTQLVQLGWIKRQQDGLFSVHQLIQEAIRENEVDNLPIEEHADGLLKFINAKSDMESSWRVFSNWVQHAEIFFNIEMGENFARGNLANGIRKWYSVIGRYSEAAQWANRYINIAKKIGDKEMAIAKGNLAGVLQEMGRYEKAEKLYRESLEICEIAYETNHFYIAIAKGNLAVVLQYMGKYEEAENLFWESLEIERRIYEPSHLEIAISKGNLAGVLKDMGRYKEAEKLYRESLKIKEQAYEPSHPAIAIDKGNIAGVLQDLGRYEEAEELYRESLKIKEEAYESNHPAIAIDKGNLALVLKKMGRYEEAEELYRESLEIDEKAYEPSHPAIAIDKGNLAVALKDMGRYEEAEELCRESLKILTDRFGSAHPHTKLMQDNLDYLLAIKSNTN